MRYEAPVAAKEKSARDALEGMSKDELVTRAEALGIEGARKFTKVELVDEIVRSTGDADRGLLGRARDLLRDVVERGLARAAQTPSARLEDPARVDAIDAARVDAAAPVPTVTLAEIFLAQGHVSRARSILEQVLHATPHDEAARALATRIDARSKRFVATTNAPSPEPEPEPAPTPPVPEGPAKLAGLEIEPEAFVDASREADAVPAVPAMLDDAPFPARYDVDECVALAVDETTVYVYWEARRATTERARRVMRSGDGDPVSTLRVLVVEPHASGPRVATRDFEIVDLEYGEYFVRDLPADAIVRAAIGVRRGERFLPIAHTLEVEVPASGPSSTVAREVVVWSEDGTRPDGGPEPIATGQPLDRDAGLLGLPPVPVPPGEPRDTGRGLSSAELARRARIARLAALRAPAPTSGDRERAGASDLLARAPSSASWLDRR